ncbi:ABC transporter ATP-binding protein [Agrobacterium vitis]|uniref:ABC transporter ATP-binding protein n=1 Tax=Allorhizobium ampelinum TaxID=3025782 RepID=UPI001F300A36|nr:ABC transporter ATP-binding protein [Allorhizobium ampelinum]MCF1462009.1 ABC transporter ATP-binding protein [Allorhizobium ampelinum]
MTAGAHLTIRDISRSFDINGKVLNALDSINLDITEGEFVTIVGASGCGKSTLLRIAAGLDIASSGTITHAGKVVNEPSLERGIVFQEPRLFPWLSVERNVAVGVENSGLPKAMRQQLVRDHLELVGLTGFAKAYPHQLSGGMAQRAGIARGLVNRPNILFLDEPCGALDAMTKTRLQDELQEIWARERITMVLVTHDVEEAVYLGDRVVVMSARPGRIRDIIPVEIERPRRRTSAEIVAARDRVLQSLHGSDEVRQSSGARPLPARENTLAQPAFSHG